MEGYGVGLAIGVVTGAGIAAGALLIAYHFSKPAIARSAGELVSTRVFGDPAVRAILPVNVSAVAQPIAQSAITLALERNLPL